MVKRKQYKKIVEWDITTHHEEPIRDNIFQWGTLIYMIPIVGQLVWLFGWVLAREARKVYWEEIKFNSKKE